MAKRWLYPAVYLGAAALIIGLMYARSQMASHSTVATMPNNNEGQQTTSTQTATTTTNTGSTYEWPVVSSVTPVVSMGFFSATDTPKQQAADLVSFNGGYAPHLGYDIKSKSGQPFTVVAAVAGEVTSIGSSALNGHVVQVLSNDGNLEKYESLGKVDVKKGDVIQQGQPIGTAGKSEYEASQGNHVYFEVDNANTPVDPAQLLPALNK